MTLRLHLWLLDKNSIALYCSQIEESCHDIEPSIRLISMYPPPSVLFNDNFHITELRLDKLGSFVVPKGLLQFAVRVATPEPVEWSFLQGSQNKVAGPSSTPQVQSDRAMTNFYDPSTFCYTSKLLINLRSKNSEMDTGTYVAKFGDKTLSFNLFVPSEYITDILKFQDLIYLNYLY